MDNLAIADGIQQTPNGDQAYIAASGTKGKGYELEISGQLLPGWNIAGGFTQVVTRGRDGQRLNPDMPKQQFKLFTTYRLPGSLERLTVGGGVTWQSVVETTWEHFSMFAPRAATA